MMRICQFCRRRAWADTARGRLMPAATKCPRDPCVCEPITQGVRRRSRSFINYWVRMTPPHGLKIGGLGMGCRKNAWYCPFSDPEPTI
jgi:hypothetical protein